MKNKQLFKIVSILVVVTIAGFFIGSFFINNNSINNKIPFDNKILGNDQDLVSFSVEAGSNVSGAMVAVGSVQGGYFFEGNILINILDSDKKLLVNGYGNAKTDWMTSEPVGFETMLDFTNLPKGPAYIEIQNDNPGAPNEGINKRILIPIIIN